MLRDCIFLSGLSILCAVRESDVVRQGSTIRPALTKLRSRRIGETPLHLTAQDCIPLFGTWVAAWRACRVPHFYPKRHSNMKSLSYLCKLAILPAAVVFAGYASPLPPVAEPAPAALPVAPATVPASVEIDPATRDGRMAAALKDFETGTAPEDAAMPPVVTGKSKKHGKK